MVITWIWEASGSTTTDDDVALVESMIITGVLLADRIAQRPDKNVLLTDSPCFFSWVCI